MQFWTIVEIAYFFGIVCIVCKNSGNSGNSGNSMFVASLAYIWRLSIYLKEKINWPQGLGAAGLQVESGQVIISKF